MTAAPGISGPRTNVHCHRRPNLDQGGRTMDVTSSLRRRSLRPASGSSLIEGFVHTRSTDHDVAVEVAGGPVRATVHVKVADGPSYSLALDGSGCGRLRLQPPTEGARVEILFGESVILSGSIPSHGSGSVA